MSVEFRPFEAEDLWKLDVQERHRWVLERIKRQPMDLSAIENAWSFTAFEGDTILACAGAVNGVLWACLAKDLRRHMVAITRYCMAYTHAHLAVVGPVHADIDPEHPEAVRWVRLCGFRQVDERLWVYDARIA